MEASENQENKASGRKNLSDSDIFSKQLLVVPEDEDLRIIGIKVKLDGDEAYSFSMDKPRSKSADVPTILTNSKTLKLSSNRNEKKDFEINIKSKDDTKDRATQKENACPMNTTNCAGHQAAKFSGINPRSYDNDSPKNFMTVPLKYVTEVSATETQTEKEMESSSMQTASVEVRQPRSTQEAEIQTYRSPLHDASTSTDKKVTKSVEIQTDVIALKHEACQSEKETATGSSQTETAAIYSVESTYEAAVQTEQVEDVGTSTDFDVHIVDRKNLVEKCVDTEDLPFAPLMVANKEKSTDVDKMIGEKGCYCFCGHRNHNRCIYKCCFHREDDNTTLGLIQCPYHASYFNGFHHCKICHCPSTSSCNKFMCDEHFRADIHELHCCKCKNLKGQKSSETPQEVTKKLKTPEGMKVDAMHLGTLATQEKIGHLSRIQIANNMQHEQEKSKTVIAVKNFQHCKVEKTNILNIPVVFEHYLTSFDLSTHTKHHAVVNPVDITLSGNETTFVEKETMHIKSSFKQSTDACLENRNQSRDLASTEIRHPQLCLCDKCYSRINNVIQQAQMLQKQSPLCREKQKKTFQSKSKFKGFNCASNDLRTPNDGRSDDVFIKKVEKTDIIYAGESSRDKTFKKIGLHDACEVVNDHLLKLRFVDENTVKKAAETLRKQWFKVAGTKHSDVQEVRSYIQYFREFSNNLLKTLLHSADENGNHVLHFAFANNRFDLAEEFIIVGMASDLLKKKNEAGNSPLMLCSISRPKTTQEWSTVRKAFQLGDINTKSSKTGQTPLMNASSCGFQAMVELLLELGANPNLQDKDGSTALMYAAEHGHERCIKSLMRRKNCDPTIRDKDGLRACTIALSNGYENFAVIIHMQALEKRRLSKTSYLSKRYIWTSNKTTASRKKALFKTPLRRLPVCSNNL